MKRSMSPRVRRVLLLTLCGSLAAREVVAQVACPASHLALNGSDATFEVARLDTSYNANQLHFDLIAGSLSLAYCCSLAPTYMLVRDAYDVEGVPAGTPVSLRVQLAVDSHVYDAGNCGGTGCCANFRASIRDETDSTGVQHSPILFDGAQAFYHDLIELPVTILAGTPRVVQFELRAQRCPGGSHGADASG